MKYGDTLRQRSIPAWGHYNIDYDFLKDLIKHHTTPGSNKAVSIPGQGEVAERAFQDTFFTALKDQHDRIDLFIRSKSGEIERRLEYISKSLAQLQARRAIPNPNHQLPAKLVERYAKIDADISKAGEEIRSLSRFRVAQRTGFTKILKKYRRWTKDTELEHRFKDEVTSSPDSFFQLDLGYLLDQYIDALGALRSTFHGNGEPNLSSDSASYLSPPWRIAKSIEGGDEIDFDLALSTIALGSHGSKALYWIHPDHFVEVQVLLLQHMRLFGGTIRPSSSPEQSRQATPGRRKSSATDKYFGNEDNVALIVLDHAESFAVRQNASTIGSTEGTKGNIGTKAAGQARWVASGDAAVVVDLGPSREVHAVHNMKTARLKRQSLEAFLDTKQPFTDKTDINSSPKVAEHKADTQAVRKWLSEHAEIAPIVGIGSKRTRFVGLNNSSSGGVWATLDRDIFMKQSLHEDLKGDDWINDARANAVKFPHAILEVRREGSQNTSLVQLLDRSHLVERVRGFSLDAHAVWACCKPTAMPAPFWIPLLDNDIRKLPAPVKRERRKPGSRQESFSSPPHTSTSGSLTDGQISPFTSRNGESSATSAPEFVEPPTLQAFRKKSRKPFAEYPPPLTQPQQPQQPESVRYWNEYDNPESDDEGYYIYIDPNASVTFPGQELFEGLIQKVGRLFGMRDSADQESLLSSGEYGDSDEEANETADDESPIGAPRTYGTIHSPDTGPLQQEGYFSGLFRSFRDPYRDVAVMDTVRRQNDQERRALLNELQVRQHQTELNKLRFYSTCFATAAVTNMFLVIMTTTSRKKERGYVDAAVLFGVIFGLLLCALGLLSMRTRREKLGWVHQGTVLTVVTAVVVVDVFLLRWVVRL